MTQLKKVAPLNPNFISIHDSLIKELNARARYVVRFVAKQYGIKMDKSTIWCHSIDLAQAALYDRLSYDIDDPQITISTSWLFSDDFEGKAIEMGSKYREKQKQDQKKKKNASEKLKKLRKKVESKIDLLGLSEKEQEILIDQLWL